MTMTNRALIVIGLPFLLPAALVLGIVLAPAAAVFWLTFRPAVRLDNAFVAVVFALLFTAVLSASIAWPVLAIYLLPL
ncbi:MAG: hypothetical protein J4N36_07520 [Chloroflexi bacterium]|nr:hypothetical protein [Chloroflexota bacterium]MCI0839704.1 hypothetical protein [Chloroflexota bacterium]MCI0843595.1 hypothetical protein [Chloroflexota bacterium]MCI0886128.1 hypothetical protein [Chloroflexota bacterium]